MNRKKFVTRYSQFVQFAMKLAHEAKRCGIESLEQEIEDIEETEKVFKEGLRLNFAVSDPAAIVNEVLSNMIAHEKNKYMRLYMTVQKRAALGLLAGEGTYVLYKVLSSLAGLTAKESWKIDALRNEDAQQMILAFIQNLADYAPSNKAPRGFDNVGKYTYPDGLVKKGAWECGGFQGKSKVFQHQISPKYNKDDYEFDNEYEKKFDEDFRELFTGRLKEDRNFGCELWSALANVGWYHEDDIEEKHECGRSFRGAGSLISDMYGDGDYVDWYCSGPYITVSEYIATQMASKG